MLWKFSNKESLVLSEELISFSPFDKENPVTERVALFSGATRKLRARYEGSSTAFLVY